MDTIFAQATAPGRSGVSVIRVSGPRALEIGRVLGGRDVPLRRPVLRRLRAADGSHIDTALMLAFGAGQSFTGEDVLEIQAHGSVAVVHAILAELSRQDDARLADPGEFTRRALENERLDLAQVEGLADLIAAETELQRKQALKVFSGALGDLVHGWRSKLLRAAALLEVTIDFVDEEVPEDVTGEVTELIAEVLGDLEKEAQGAEVSERIRQGFEVAIVGLPNVGKSTLLNALAGREAAITSEREGTTRDIIEVRMDLKGIPVTFLDTAGLREAEDEVEQIGVERARARAREADLRVFLVSTGHPGPDLEPEEDDLVVLAKADLFDSPVGLSVSGRTGQGLESLVDRIAGILSGRLATQTTANTTRQRLAILDALKYGNGALDEIRKGPERVEYAADEIRNCIRSLEMMVGHVDVEHVLDVIFGSFCLGK